MKNSDNSNSVQELFSRNLMLLGWVTVIFLLPFSINNFIQGRNVDGLLVGLLIIFAAINSLSLQHKKRSVIPYWFFFTFKLSTLLHVIYNLGEVGLFWSYPLGFVIFFVQPCVPARVMSGVIAITVISLSLYLFEIELVARFGFTLLMLMMFCDVLVGVLMRMESKLSEQAVRDPLTNAYNRRYMNTCLETTMEETLRDFGPACLVVLDIDHFKSINDEYGHSVGDTALVNLVELLHKRKRKLDYVFRTGGEEFVLLLRNTSMRQAVNFAESIRKTIEETHLIVGTTITISMGVAEYQAGESDDEWLKRADENLYKAKKSGRNCVCPQETSIMDYHV